MTGAMTEPTVQFPSLWIVIGLAVASLVTVVQFLYGKSLGKRGAWLSGFSLFVFLILSTVALVGMYPVDGIPEPWKVGWVWPRGVLGSLVVGIRQDLPGAAFSVLSCLLAFVLVLNETTSEKGGRRAAWTQASVTLGALGACLSWLSISVWFSFFGIALTILGGVFALAIDWNNDHEATRAARFGFEKSLALFVAIFGAAMLAGKGVSLVWDEAAIISPSTGVWVLLSGVFLLAQPFPLLGLLATRSESPSRSRVIAPQTFGALAALGLAVRLSPHLASTEAFKVFGWVNLSAAALASLSGLVQSDWRQSLSIWISASLSVCFAALAQGGAPVAIGLGVAMACAAVAFSLFGESLETDEAAEQLGSAGKIQAGAVVAALIGSGMIGTASTGGRISWLASVSGDPTQVVLVALSLFLLNILTWRVAWFFFAQSAGRAFPRMRIALAYLVVLFSLGFFWTGSITGGAIPGEPDAFILPIVGKDLSLAALKQDVDPIATASLVYWAVFCVAIGFSYWSAMGGRDIWAKLGVSAPKLHAFFSSGYRVDSLGQRLSRGWRQLGGWTDRLIGTLAWEKWIPTGLFQSTRWLAGAMTHADEAIDTRLGKSTRTWIEIPAKTLQLIQSGDIQWYLLFGIGSGIAILIHFLTR